jgi:hypothetical protein
VTSRPDVAPHPLACVARVTSRPDLVSHPYSLARVARGALCCAPTVPGRILPALLADARAAHWRRPRPSCAPAIAVALHPPVVATAKVRVTDELRTGDLGALRGINSAPVSSSTTTSFIRLSSKETLRLRFSACCKCMFKCFICLRGMLQGLRMEVAKVN